MDNEQETIVRDHSSEPTDFILTGDYAWLTVAGHSLYITRYGNKLSLEWFRHGDEGDEPDAVAIFDVKYA